MSGGLARLVLRAQGQLPVAEPLLPSRYAPAGPVSATADPLAAEDGGSEAAEPAPAPLARAMPSVPPAPSTPVFRDMTGAEPVAAPQLSVRAQPAALPGGVEPEAPLPERRQASPADPAGAAEACTPPAGNGKPEILARAAAPPMQPLPAAAGARTEAEPLHSFRTEIPRVARAMPPAAAALAPVRAPDVQINIGRVEVHAASARAAPVRAVPARRPLLSLADYLAQRK